METIALAITTREPWNKGKLVGQKTPFKLKEIWAIRVRLQMASRGAGNLLFSIWQSTANFEHEPHAAEGTRCLPPSDNGISGARSAAEDSATRSIRNHRADARRGYTLDRLFSVEAKLESTVRHLGIEVDDALEMAEQTEV